MKKQHTQGYYYLVVAHQSTPDPKMILRLLKYDTAVIEEYLKQGYTTFPVPINLVFYTGSKCWKHSTSPLVVSGFFPDTP
jgi:predicted transposase YdaD